MTCPVCETGKASVFFKSGLSTSVRSDSVAVNSPVTVYLCSSCGHLFKDPATVKNTTDYQAYDTKRDKVDYSAQMPVTRSEALLENLRTRGLLTVSSRVLDYGCNRGMFLALLQKGDHAGYDVAENYRAAVEALGFQYFTPKAPPPKNSFDLLTLIHVYEHLPVPKENLSDGADALKSDGTALIQLPDPQIQPTDLYVSDHCHHFSPRTLDLSLATCGMIPLKEQMSPVHGEITRVYRKSLSAPPSKPSSPDFAALEKVRLALVHGEETLLALKSSGKPCVIYGCGSLGILISEVLRGQATAFIDDDPGTHGLKIQGLPVIPLSANKDRATTIVIASQPGSSAKLMNKCNQSGFSSIAPYLPAI